MHAVLCLHVRPANLNPLGIPNGRLGKARPALCTVRIYEQTARMMDLKSGYPFWAIKNGLMHSFPSVCRARSCDVIVVGGGITGALIADELSRNGHDVMVLERRDAGWGSSAASTALLQYEIDTHMVDLSKKYGESDAALAYQACADAIPMLAELAQEVGDVDFAPMRSLYFASHRFHAPSMRREFAMRARHGFQVELLERRAVHEQFALSTQVAILSQQAARIDPYRMAYRLLMRMQQKGTDVVTHTSVERIESEAHGVVVTTSNGARLRARHLVLAGGYENQRWLKKRVANNRSSYAFITEPLDPSMLGALRDTMVWESARPYLYLRTTSDHRLLVGGEDDAIDVPARRDARVNRKATILKKRVRKLWPELVLKPAFAWAGTFAETADGLPFFGPHPQLGPRVLFAMAYGGNGITYSMLGAGLLRAQIEGRGHALSELFSFRRC